MPEVSDLGAVVKAINFLNFLLGGVVVRGRLWACWRRAYPSQATSCGLLPRWLASLECFVALTGELSWFSLIAYPANFFIPITQICRLHLDASVAVALTRGRKTVHACVMPATPRSLRRT